jgi:hypothetical protein
MRAEQGACSLHHALFNLWTRVSYKTSNRFFFFYEFCDQLFQNLGTDFVFTLKGIVRTILRKKIALGIRFVFYTKTALILGGVVCVRILRVSMLTLATNNGKNK